MGDYKSFQLTIRQTPELYGEEESTFYSPFYKFKKPNSHRIQGGLRIVSGNITAALRLLPDPRDKELKWPAKLRWRLMEIVDGEAKDLGQQDAQYELEDVRGNSEELQWDKSITFKLAPCKEQELVYCERGRSFSVVKDIVTIVWAVELYTSSPHILMEVQAPQEARKIPVVGGFKANVKRNGEIDSEQHATSKEKIPRSRHVKKSVVAGQIPTQ